MSGAMSFGGVTAARYLQVGDLFYGVDGSRLFKDPVLIVEVDRTLQGRYRIKLEDGRIKAYEAGRRVRIA